MTQGSLHRLLPYLLLTLSSLFWAGNWVTGRALREAFGPVAISFWRWAIAVVIVLPFVWRELHAQRHLIRRHWRLLTVLALSSVVFFNTFVYVGLRTTQAINGVLLSSCIPLFILLATWWMDGQRASRRQLIGMALSFLGILAIVTRGEWQRLADLGFHEGDLWILVAVPIWAFYSVLLKRKPAALSGLPLVAIFSAIGVLVLAPAYVLEMLYWVPPVVPSWEALAGVAYIGVFASVAAFVCWNAGVAAVGANIAGFTVHLLPLFGTLLAILFLGEQPRLFHVAGFAAILAGVLLATWSGQRPWVRRRGGGPPAAGSR